MINKITQIWTGKKNESKNKDVLPEEISTKFQENLAVLDNIDSVMPGEINNVIQNYLSNGQLGNIMSTYGSIFENAINKCEKINGKNLPKELKEEYWNSYERVSSRIGKIFGGQ
jgi:hypothetical protein